MNVIDDFLSQDELLEVQSLLTANTFPWFLGKPTTDELTESRYDLHFSHVFYSNFSVNSEYVGVLEPFLRRIDPIALIRVKANLTMNTETIVENGFHVDVDNKKCTTAVFYVNSNDGYTTFVDGEKIQSVENRMLVFNSQAKHSGTTTTDQPFRIVINFNYIAT